MSCDFCDEQKGLETAYSRIYGDKRRIVHETNSFLVFPCMGQLREGHLLVSSKAHINAAGMLDEGAAGELEALVAEVAGFFRDVYRQDLLCFEHGVLDDEGTNGGCGIYHMHLHLIPANRREFLSALELVRNCDANMVSPSRGLRDTCGCVAAKKTYLYLAMLENLRRWDAFIVTNKNNYFESQYMRKIICKVFGETGWDWRERRNPELELLNTLEQGRGFFAGRVERAT